MKHSLVMASCGILLLALCCGCDGRGARAESIEPAMLITNADASELTGGSFSGCTASEQPAVGLKLCVYDNGKDFLQIGLTRAAFMAENSRREPKEIFNGIRAAFPDAAKIEGVGDDNFVAPPGIHILQGDSYISLSLGLMTRDQDKLKAAALKAIENLNRLRP